MRDRKALIELAGLIEDLALFTKGTDWPVREAVAAKARAIKDRLERDQACDKDVLERGA